MNDKRNTPADLRTLRVLLVFLIVFSGLAYFVAGVHFTKVDMGLAGMTIPSIIFGLICGVCVSFVASRIGFYKGETSAENDQKRERDMIARGRQTRTAG